MGLVNCALRSSSLPTHWMFHEDFVCVSRDINDDKILKWWK